MEQYFNDIVENINLENDSNIEKTIDDILNNLTHKEYESLSNVNEKKQIIIDNLFEKYKYENNNLENKNNLLEELGNFRFIETNEVQKNDIIKYIDLKFFTHLKLSNMLCIREINDNFFSIYAGVKHISFKKTKKIFFKKINNKDLVKMKLIEYLD